MNLQQLVYAGSEIIIIKILSQKQQLNPQPLPPSVFKLFRKLIKVSENLLSTKASSLLTETSEALQQATGQSSTASGCRAAVTGSSPPFTS